MFLCSAKTVRSFQVTWELIAPMLETARLIPREDYVKVLEMRQRTAAAPANATPKFVLFTHESIITTLLTDADTLFREMT